MGFLYLKIKDLLKSVLQLVPVCEVPYVGRGSQSSLRPSLGSWRGAGDTSTCGAQAFPGFFLSSGQEEVFDATLVENRYSISLKKHICCETTEKVIFASGIEHLFFPMCEQMHVLIFELLAEETQASISGQDSDIFEPRAYKSPGKSSTQLPLTTLHCVVYYLEPRGGSCGG